ncbi:MULTISPECIES: zinc-binding alcohol dehydrogenase family protein [unclassified Mycobacterium]|uniref:quinone oxidoreductase family protein n=1 Tax=unclassified Mycobacterium TaxID=2642494 RepID=UPI0029C93C36|nr:MULTISPECIES: zinc-binding alcohol dehydrogenase family protein [unclassified Mycobacterium]
MNNATTNQFSVVEQVPSRVAAAIIDQPGASPRLGTVDLPATTPGRSLLRVLAAPVNPLDLHIASGTFHSLRHDRAYVPGSECIGVVMHSARYEPGERVYAQCIATPDRPGSLATHVVVGDEDVVPVPGDVDAVTAAAVGNSGIAAYLPLIQTARLKAGDSVLILGATGTVGQLAVQIARSHQAARVVGVGRDTSALEQVLGLGADAVVELRDNDTEDELADRLLKATNGRVDVVLDGLYALPLQAALRVCSPHGRVVNIGNAAGASAEIPAGLLRSRQLTVVGFAGLHVPMTIKEPALVWLWRQIAARKLHVPVERSSLVDIGRTWSLQESSPHAKHVVFFA